MPNQRSQGQKQVLIWVDDEFLNKINQSMARAGYGDRSSFIRAAVYEKLVRLGIPVDPRFALAPSRVGKGGPRQPADDETAILNENPEPVVLSPSRRVKYSKPSRRKKGKSPRVVAGALKRIEEK
jgi:hypothetical protein